MDQTQWPMTYGAHMAPWVHTFNKQSLAGGPVGGGSEGGGGGGVVGVLGPAEPPPPPLDRSGHQLGARPGKRAHGLAHSVEQ